ncbi:MAG: site-specific integrase [Pirellulales bacterium]
MGRLKTPKTNVVTTPDRIDPPTEFQAGVARFLDYLRIEKNASDYTTKSYREDLADVEAYFVAQQGTAPPPDCLTTLDLRGYLAGLHERSLAHTTIARRLASLRSFFRFGRREGWSNGNPAKPLRNPRKQRHLPHFLDNTQIETLLNAPQGNDPQATRNRAILETLYSCGLRSRRGRRLKRRRLGTRDRRDARPRKRQTRAVIARRFIRR